MKVELFVPYQDLISQLRNPGALIYSIVTLLSFSN